MASNTNITNKSVHSVILSLSNTEKEKLCCGMLDLPFPAEDIGISYSVFGALFDIAENYATNRNNAIFEMIRKYLPDINIKSIVRKYQQQPKKKPSADNSLEELIILPPQSNKLPFLDEAVLKDQWSCV